MLEPAAHRDLVRLIRFMLGGRVAGGKAGSCGVLRQGHDALVTRGDGVARSFAQSAIRDAVSLGLMAEEDAGERVRDLPEAATFLKRALSAPNEGFGAQHRTIAEADIETSAGRRRVQLNLAESPLAIVARLKEKSGKPYLPPEAIEAGERLSRDFTRAQLQPRMTMAYEPRLATRTKGAGGAGALADSAMAARGRVAGAMEALGPELCGVAIDVCGFEKGLETVERERQWPARSAKLMLRAALMALARHYAPPPRTNSAR